MISPAEMRVLDRNAQHFGVSILELMENAGKAVADAARSEFGAAGKNVLGPGGAGNKCGDGLPAAPHPPQETPATGLPSRLAAQLANPEGATKFLRLQYAPSLAGPR